MRARGSSRHVFAAITASAIAASAIFAADARAQLVQITSQASAAPSLPSHPPHPPHPPRVRIYLPEAHIDAFVPGGDFEWRVDHLTRQSEGFDQITRVAAGVPALAMTLSTFRPPNGSCAEAMREATARGMQPLPESVRVPDSWSVAPKMTPRGNGVQIQLCMQTMRDAKVAVVDYDGPLGTADAQVIEELLAAIQLGVAVDEDKSFFAAVEYDLRAFTILPNDGRLANVTGAAFGTTATFFGFGESGGTGFRTNFMIGGGNGQRIAWEVSSNIGLALHFDPLLIAGIVGLGADGLSGPASVAYEMRGGWNAIAGGLAHVVLTPRINFDVTAQRVYRFDIGFDSRPDVPHETQYGVQLRVLPWRGPAGAGFQGITFGARYTDFGDAKGIMAIGGATL